MLYVCIETFSFKFPATRRQTEIQVCISKVRLRCVHPMDSLLYNVLAYTCIPCSFVIPLPKHTLQKLEDKRPK